jgi:hypothetical protein
MAGKDRISPQKSGTDGGENPAADMPITEKNIGRVEEETIAKASEAIRVLEDALAKWDAQEKKPEEYEQDFEGLRQLYGELVDWEQRILKSRASDERLDFYSRVDRLLVFARIFTSRR